MSEPELIAYVLEEKKGYEFGLSHMGGLAKYFACTLIGDLDLLCKKGSGEKVVAYSYTYQFKNDILGYAGICYKVTSVTYQELIDWADKFDANLAVRIKQEVLPLLSRHTRTEAGEKSFAHFAKQYAENH